MLLSLTIAVPAQDPADNPFGHSRHGNAFDEGPRQSAHRMPGMSTQVHLAVAGLDAEAQTMFDQGLTQLHGFWYFEAERSFRQAATLDPQCAIAYWGMALANVNNEKRARGFIAEAVKRKSGTSERETLYIDALDAYFKADPKKRKERGEAYAKAFEKLLYKYPSDIEARALLALQLWKNRDGGTPITSFG